MISTTKWKGGVLIFKYTFKKVELDKSRIFKKKGLTLFKTEIFMKIKNNLHPIFMQWG